MLEISGRFSADMLVFTVMIYRFEDFELDPRKVELRRGGVALPLEPQVFALLRLLVEQRDRLVSKDEIVEQIWRGRIVSDAAIASRVKSARQALGDDGRNQRLIRTIHGRGFRFVAAVEVEVENDVRPAAPATAGETAPPVAASGRKETGRPSIVVLPFHMIGGDDGHGAIADALPHDLIMALARLRWLFVIARGSAFRFRAPDPDFEQIRQLLQVRYCLTGMIEIRAGRVRITVELADTRDRGVLWGDSFAAPLDDIHEIRVQLVAAIVAALELQIPLNEARAALLATPESLDAWSSYHLGLHHLLRFNRIDNARAAGLFARAIAEEPGFARAHAGLSSAHFQNAFLQYTGDPEAEIRQARAVAETGVGLDPMDPFSNFAMGRTFWLRGDLDGSRGWLERATALSPNYAQGIYAQAWTDTLAGHGHEGIASADTAMALSPLDPFLYAMLGTKALACLVRGEDGEAAFWGEKAARAPGAHELIALIALIAHSLNGDRERAAYWAKNATGRRPDLTTAHFFQSFPFRDDAIRRRIARALDRHDIA
jgi:TolB-like protein